MDMACCGLDCGKCEAFEAYHENDRVLAQKLAESWSKTYGQELSAEDVFCQGCHSQKRTGYCAECEVRSCCYNEGVDNCTECDDYPCDKIIKLQLLLPAAKEQLYCKKKK